MGIIKYTNQVELVVIITQICCYANQIFVHSYMFPINIYYLSIIITMNLLAVIAFYKANHLFQSPQPQLQLTKFKKNMNLPDHVEYCKNCQRYIVVRDHHCIFLGQCVDRKNYIYFLSYVMYSYFLSTLLVLNLVIRFKVFYYAYKLGYQSYILSGGFGLISGLFFLFFTCGLFTSSIRLTIQGVTKVQELKNKKNKLLGRKQLARKLFSLYGFSWLCKQYRKNYNDIFKKPFEIGKLLLPFF